MSNAAPGDVFAALFAAHHAGDYWLQTGHQAAVKGERDSRGRLACARHVATLTACKAVSLAVLHASGRRVSPRRAVIALAADAASHYWADRRYTLRGLADRLGAGLIPGKGEFWRAGQPREGRDDNPCMGTGGALLDQAWHIAWLQAASLIAAGGDE
jgi:hypothetical protein